ncbi:MAG TPA: hypothetical protein VGN89_06575, partial [Phenylobacterium sp.]|nr:hypothetical protein [Phenylobacterium sp.]
MRIRIWLAAAVVAFGGGASAGEADDALTAIKAIKREGVGNERAAKSWRELVGQGPKALPDLMAAFDGADATVVNWLRTAVEAIAEAEQKAGRPLPVADLEAVVKDTRRSPRARELAFEILGQIDPAMGKRLLPGMLDDPSSGLRRDAIALALEDLDKKGPGAEKAALTTELKTLLAKARDVDQVESIAKKLKAEGVESDLIAHFGLITRWQVAGPFDNTGLKGFFAELPAKVQWKDHATGENRGMVDLYVALNKKSGLDPKTKKKDAVYALARTEIESPAERPVEIRAGSQNAVRIYLNGKEIFSRDEYHHGLSMDQHIAAGTLQKGRNEILIKVCQDDATPEWTLVWCFQLRVCDAIGGAVPFTVLTAPDAVPVKPEEKKEPAK